MLIYRVLFVGYKQILNSLPLLLTNWQTTAVWLFRLEGTGRRRENEGRDRKLRRRERKRERDRQREREREREAVIYIYNMQKKKKIIFEDRKWKREIKLNKTERLRKKHIWRLRLGKCYHTLTASRWVWMRQKTSLIVRGTTRFIDVSEKYDNFLSSGYWQSLSLLCHSSI